MTFCRRTAQHKSLSRSCADYESSRFSLSHRVGYGCQRNLTQQAGMVSVTWRGGRGMQTTGRGRRSWRADLQDFKPGCLYRKELVWHQTQHARAGVCSCQRSSVFAVLVQLIAALRTCLCGKIQQHNYPTVIIPDNSPCGGAYYNIGCVF